MRKRFILIRIRDTLKDIIRYYKIMVAMKEAETGLSNLVIENRIMVIAQEMGVNSNLAVRVANCESNLNSIAININAKGSVDRGIFQWNDKYHPEISNKCAFDIKCSTRAFCKAVNEGHLDWWNASKSCWIK